MKTLMLRSMQQPSQVDQLLASLVHDIETVHGDSEPVRTQSALPCAIQKIIIQARKAGSSWSCWRDGTGGIRLFIGEMSLSLSRERGAPVLHVAQYGTDGLTDTTNWIADGQGHWRRSFD